MNSLTRNDVARWLLEQDHYVILTHRRPDGDTLGSAAVLCRALRQMGKTAYILKNNEMTEKYIHLHEGLTCDEVSPEATLVCVDVAAPDLIPARWEALRGRIALRIDHHASATSFTELELVDPTAGACGDILYDVLRLLSVHIDKMMAEALYTAVSTDTGCFRYANTTAHSYEVAAACAHAGGDLHSINQAIFDTNSLARLRLQGWIVENIRLYRGGTVAVCALPLEVEQALGVTEDDMENISGFPRSIEGVKISATLRQGDGDTVKLSVRALPGYDAAAVCARFGGGGHKGAAGATISLPLSEAAAAVTQAMEELLQ